MSGEFRRQLSDLIRDLHNSNKHLVQITLAGEKLPEQKFFLLGFVPAIVLNIKNEVWFSILKPEQIVGVDKFLEKTACY